MRNLASDIHRMALIGYHGVSERLVEFLVKCLPTLPIALHLE
jgi:hypothetical protein